MFKAMMVMMMALMLALKLLLRLSVTVTVTGSRLLPLTPTPLLTECSLFPPPRHPRRKTKCPPLLYPSVR